MCDGLLQHEHPNRRGQSDIAASGINLGGERVDGLAAHPRDTTKFLPEKFFE